MRAVLPGAPNVPSGDRLELPPADPERLVILQYTSGSTSEPKGVMIPDRVLTANLDACLRSGRARCTDEVMVSWLPLYHDMGLVGFLALPMTMGVELVQAAPQDFMAKPGNWMQWISDWRGTATAGPNFSWVLATRALQRAGRPRPVDADAGAERCRAGRPGRRSRPSSPPPSRSGSGRASVFPAFGMAETAIGGDVPACVATAWCATRSTARCSSAPRRQAGRGHRPRRLGARSPAGSRCSAPPCRGWR